MKNLVFGATLLAVSAIAAPLFPALAVEAEEGASPWIKTEQTSVRLIAESPKIGGDNQVQLGLHFKMKKGWKIYWRNPGDAGFPPQLNWANSENLGETGFGWPAPERFEVLGFQTMGYKKEVVFPITATVTDPAQPLRLRATLDYLTCDDVCIPYKADLALDLESGTGPTTENFHLINKYDALIPGDGANHGLAIESVETAGDFVQVAKEIRKGFIRVTATSAVPFSKPDVFVEGPELAFFSVPEVTLTDGGKRAVLKIPATEEENTDIKTASLRLTLTDGARSAEQVLPVTVGAPESAFRSTLPISLPIILALAVIGGLILNLMPCVLPVISLKVLNFVSHGGAENRVIRKSFFATSLGIVSSFLAIAAGLVALKFAGGAVGWGIQFQQPWFIVGLIVLVSLFAFNLWGFFEVRLPDWLSSAASRGTGKRQDHQSFAGNFGTGAFATILATPCSAPFLGTAVGFALAGSTFDVFAVFFALGFGMALPFILIALVPALASKLPKPGNWMNRMKQVLGFALAATAVWLLTILAVQISLDAAIIVGILMAALGIAFFGRARLPEQFQKAVTAGVLIAIIASFATPYTIARPAPGGVTAKVAGHWQTFDPEAIPALVAEGKTVFVDITAEWCITCQVNKATVLNRGEVFDLLSGGQVVTMQGDWTRPDQKISDYLKSFNRFGIPFNAIYGPAAKTGMVLPELLTAGIVLDGLRKGSGNKVVVSK